MSCIHTDSYRCRRSAFTLVELLAVIAIRAEGHHRVAYLWQKLGRRDEARSEYETARDLRKKPAAASPTVSYYQVHLGGSYCNLGSLIRDGGQPADSLHWYDLAIRTLRPVYEIDRRDVSAKEFLRNSHGSRATPYDRLKKHAEAAKDWDRAIEPAPGRNSRPTVPIEPTLACKLGRSSRPSPRWRR